MRIQSAQLQHVGPFRSRVVVDGFVDGVNVLAATNETGKSTLIKAIARGLFDRHTCKDAEIKSLQPVGTDLSPQIAVEFETAEGQFKIAKAFLNSPRALLEEWKANAWQTLAEGDQADRRVQQLLRSQKAGRGATSAGHWGLMNYLWARQGEETSWPDWNTEAGELVRSRLTHVVLDPLVDALQESLWSEYTQSFTGTGQVKKGGALLMAQSEVASLEEALQEVRSSLQLMEEQSRQFKELSAEQRGLNSEAEALRQKASEVKAQALKVERVEVELSALRSRYESSQQALNRVHEHIQALEGAETERAKTKERLEEARARVSSLEQKRRLAAERLNEGEEGYAEQKKQQVERRQTLEKHRALVSVADLEKETTELNRLLAKTASQREKLRDFEKRLERCGSIKATQVKGLEALERQLQDGRLQLETLGLTVELEPKVPTAVEIKRGKDSENIEVPGGERVQLRSPRSLDLELKGWGRVHIRSGSEEVGGLVDQIENLEEKLLRDLHSLAFDSVDEAREGLRQKRSLKEEIKLTEASLEALMDGYGSFEDVEKRLTKLQKKRAKVLAENSLTEEQLGQPKTELEAQEEASIEKLKQADQTLDDCEAQLKQLRAALLEARSAEAEALSLVTELKTGCKHWTERVEELRRGFPDGMDGSLAQAQRQFVEAEARYQAKQSELPEDASRLPERNRRAATAAAEVEGELARLTRRMDQLRGSLEALGGQGLYSQETTLVEKLQSAKDRERRARDRGWSARIVHDLIGMRKTEATREVLKPLEDRLSGAFADITGDLTRRVFLDDNLGIKGIGEGMESLIPFRLLSQGAKEQLLLCLRVAVAAELAETEAQVLILDDVLVNTDSARRERILDLLASLQQRVQVVVLTCHPHWYRGVGERLELRVE